MLGENIKIYRQKKGYTQEEVANRLHVTRQTISKWEKNYSESLPMLKQQLNRIQKPYREWSFSSYENTICYIHTR